MVPQAMIPLALAACLVVLPACTGGTPEAPTQGEAPAAQPSEKASLPLATLQAESVNAALTPSPAEMQAALTQSGISTSLASLVKQRDLPVKAPNKDQVAVRTGVVIADLVLTVKSASKEDLVVRLGRIKEGMALLGAGEDIDRTIDDLVNRIQNDAVSRDELVKEFDELSGVIIPEVEFQAGPRSVPLIKAGSWLEGANLVASAIRSADQYEAADALLRQPEVVRYFLHYVQTDGQDKAPDAVIEKLESTLLKLRDITAQPTLSAEDVQTIHVETDSVLALL